jgi:hypothetical protein
MKLEDDRIMKFLDACYDAGIKRPEAFILSKMPQVYGWLKGAFPRGILPTDIDGEVEINGHFLRMEFKHESAMRNGRIPKGQHAALKSLVNTKKFTVLLIGTNDGGEPTCYEVWHHNGSITKLMDGDVAQVFDLCRRWSKYAEQSK